MERDNANLMLKEVHDLDANIGQNAMLCMHVLS